MEFLIGGSPGREHGHVRKDRFVALDWSEIRGVVPPQDDNRLSFRACSGNQHRLPTVFPLCYLLATERAGRMVGDKEEQGTEKNCHYVMRRKEGVVEWAPEKKNKSGVKRD